MTQPRLKLAALAVALAFAGNAGADDFLQTYRLAKQYDAPFAGARASLEAGLEKLPQGRALLLPVINGTANTTWNEVNNRLLGTQLGFNSNGYAVTLTQPLFRWQNLVQYKQSEFQVLQSEAQFGQATQDLIVRVAQAYFDVLAAQDNLDFTKANKIAIAEQLAQAKRNFEVGTATITDTNEAQARFDLAGAQEIAGLNALEVAWRALQQIIGEIPKQLTPLKAVAMNAPVPSVMDDWAKAARGNNFVVRGNEAVFEIATKEIERQRAGHYPTLDVVTSYQDNASVNPNVLGPRNTINQGQVGLQLSLPIFAGGSVLSRTREAVALREKARQDLEASRRAAEFNARQSYLNVTNGLAQVKALEQALVSSETALQSNRVGYEVGVRINIDVLNAQQQVFQTKRDLARARYDTILNGLRLKSAAGSLTELDVDVVNLLLGFDASEPVPVTPPKPTARMFDAPAPTARVAPSAPAREPIPEKTAKSVPATEAARTKRAAATREKNAPASKTVETRAIEAAPPVVAPVAADPVPLAKPLETVAPAAEPVPAKEAVVERSVEKSVETALPAPSAPAAEPVAAETLMPVAMQPGTDRIDTPAAVLEKALPVPPESAAAPDGRDVTPRDVTPRDATQPAAATSGTAKKNAGKTAAKSIAPRTKKPARAPDLASAEPAATPAEATPAEEPAARVYSIVEPRIPGSATRSLDGETVAARPAAPAAE